MTANVINTIALVTVQSLKKKLMTERIPMIVKLVTSPPILNIFILPPPPDKQEGDPRILSLKHAQLDHNSRQFANVNLA